MKKLNCKECESIECVLRTEPFDPAHDMIGIIERGGVTYLPDAQKHETGKSKLSEPVVIPDVAVSKRRNGTDTEVVDNDSAIPIPTGVFIKLNRDKFAKTISEFTGDEFNGEWTQQNGNIVPLSMKKVAI